MNELLTPGGFTVGCNYLASHAGTHMWRDWRPDVIDADFAALASQNLHLIRTFPIWDSFQPISALYGPYGEIREYRFGEEPLPDTPVGQMGVSEEALEHFQVLCDLAAKHGLKLIIGVINGWMSSRLFIPPALERRNLITDPIAVMWELRFVHTFVRRFAHEPAIAAWDLGNECNNLQDFETEDQMYVWASNIAGAIRSEDPTRPVISGMHGLLPEGHWNIRKQAEVVDLLTTHPYPGFTAYANNAPVNTMLPELHGTSESLMYRGIGQKPCFVEETGILGPTMGNQQVTAQFARASMFSLWAHDCRAYIWWDAFDQYLLEHAPYDWNAIERELGLFSPDRQPKPVVQEIGKFAAFLQKSGLETLPPRITDTVCILSHDQDTWAAAYMSFVLGKQAGLDLTYAFSDQKLPDAPCYLLPCMSIDRHIPRRRMHELLAHVENGSVLYLSVDNAIISRFEQMTGMRVDTRSCANYEDAICMEADGEVVELPIFLHRKLMMSSVGAEILASDRKGNPILTVSPYGKGKVILLTAPLETYVSTLTGPTTENAPYYRVYQCIADRVVSNKVAKQTISTVGLTEHIVDEHTRLLVLINYDPETVTVPLTLQDGWKISRFLRGSLELSGNDGAVIEITA